MERLTPLVVRLLVATAAVIGGREDIGLEEGIAFDGTVSGRGDVAGAEGEVVTLRNVLSVLLAGGILVGKLLLRLGLVGVSLDLRLG